MELLGIDVGGSGIKGAIVNTSTGELISERHRIPTPQPATPALIAKTVKKLVDHFHWTGPVGVSFPTVVKKGKCHTSGNIHPDWIGVQVDELFSKYCNGLTFRVGNDADLAGIAEMSMGAGKGVMGKVIMITIGTGIGSGFFYNGQLIPNFELGRIYHTDGHIIELYASDAARKREGLSMGSWAKRFDVFLHHVARNFSPDLFIIGGGISKKYDKYKQHFTVPVPVKVAHFRNNAGIIGAAMYVEKLLPAK